VITGQEMKERKWGAFVSTLTNKIVNQFLCCKCY